MWLKKRLTFYSAVGRKNLLPHFEFSSLLFLAPPPLPKKISVNRYDYIPSPALLQRQLKICFSKSRFQSMKNRDLKYGSIFFKIVFKFSCLRNSVILMSLLYDTDIPTKWDQAHTKLQSLLILFRDIFLNQGQLAPTLCHPYRREKTIK